MRAIIYTEYGPPEVLQLQEVAKPTPKDNEILIKVMAAEVTKGDCELRSFNFPVKWFWLPLRLAWGAFKPKKPILGGYFAGEVEATGKEVTKFKAGDQIFGSARLRMGAYGEYLCLPETHTLVPKPQNASFAEAAAVPLGGFNALHYMRKGNIRQGEKVLINGAGGSIGVYGLQIAKAMGAEVTAVDSGIKEEMLMAIGADHFIDYAKEDFTKSGTTYDVIFDMVAGNSYSSCIRTLNPKGRYLMANPLMVYMLRSVITPMFTDKKVIFAFAGEKAEELMALKDMIEAGQIKPIVDKVYPMEEVVEAHHRVQDEQRLGPVVLAVVPEI
jgi:NADPH:quinone reductase-like Zn-dependent oxidoreductase